MERCVFLFNPPAPAGGGYTREGRCTQEAGAWGTQWPPLSLATAAKMLKDRGVRAVVRDYPASGGGTGELREDLARLRPSHAIWSTATETIEHDLLVARLVREESAAAVTAVFGTHVTALPGHALAEGALDVVICGEPEGVICELVAAGRSFDRLRGVAFRGGDGSVRLNPPAPFLAPEDIPYPDWEDLDLDAYRIPLKGNPFLLVAPLRGCPWRCTFCTVPLYYGRGLRRRPVANVVAEIRRDCERYAVRDFFFWADTFTADPAYVRELCRAIKEAGLEISWTCNSRVDTVDEETLLAMKEAGLWMISFGLESAGTEVLAGCGKGISVEQSRRAVEMARGLGIRVAGHFIFGLPGETRGSLAETLEFALSLPLDVAQFYTAAPFPGTALYREALQQGWLKVPEGWACFSQQEAILDLPGLPAREVDAFRRLAYRRFYGRPVAAARLLSLLRPAGLAQIWRAAIPFWRWSGLKR